MCNKCKTAPCNCKSTDVVSEDASCGPCTGTLQVAQGAPVLVADPVLPVGTAGPCGDGLTPAECLVVTKPIKVNNVTVVPANSTLTQVITNLFTTVDQYQPEYNETQSARQGINIIGDGSNTAPYVMGLKRQDVPANPITVTDAGVGFAWNQSTITSFLDAVKSDPLLKSAFVQTLAAVGYTPSGSNSNPDTTTPPDTTPPVITCAAPITLSAVNVTSTGAKLQWNNPPVSNTNNSPQQPTGYSLSYRRFGTVNFIDLGELLADTGESITNPSYSVFQLLPATTYEWRVRRNCGQTQSSTWVQSTFTTQPVIDQNQGCGSASNLTVNF